MPKTSVAEEMLYLRKRAKEPIKEYVTEHLPEQRTHDNREKLQAMELFKDTHLVKLELLSNATTIDNALNYIRTKQQEQRKRERVALDSTGDDNYNNSDDNQLTKAGRQTVF